MAAGQIKVGIIGGTGLGDALCGEVGGRRREVDTPFGRPSDAIIETTWGGVDVAVLNRHGAGHLIAPTAVNYRANIYALKALGCTHILASGAVGSLREAVAPTHLVVADQIIDKTFRRESSFFNGSLACHVEMAYPFCPVLRRHLLNCASGVPTTVHGRGTYVCMEGPAFSTRAESEMHRQWGGDLIGMTAMPEAKLAREAEIAYALVALVSDYDCWRPHPDDLDKHELLKEILAHVHAATAHAIALIRLALERFGEIAGKPCPAHSALELAIWSDRSKIAPETAERLGPLLAKYV
ncbi:MAG: S-methyl-5'-thioadenosine phosphorylase [Planctomycetes bacterium]|nr:S-methyl-5'-thioadenosine phosphorylase [Planctomycetota bacterium]